MNIAIPASKIDLFEKKVNKLNKKIKSLGKAPITFVVGEKFIKKVQFTYHTKGERFADDIVENINVAFISITVDGIEVFKRDDKDYTFIGTVTNVDGIKTVNCIDDQYIEHFKKDITFCDHCKTGRKRNQYFLFVDQNGKVINIGSSCAEEYFGIDVKKYLGVFIQTFFVSGGEYEDDDCYLKNVAFDYDCVYRHLKEVTNDFTKWEKGDTTTELKNHIRKVSVAPIKSEYTIDDIRNYWNGQSIDSGFSLNMQEAVKNDFCVERNFGIFAYAIFGAVNGIRKNKAEAISGNNTAAESQYKDGDKVTIEGVATHISSYQSFYNRSMIYRIEFKGSDDVYYYMNTSAKGMCDIHVGDKFSVKGTINGRNDFRDKRRWVIKSPRLV